MFQIKNLSYSYKLENKTENIIFQNLNFDLPNKGLIFITGKSGCGKTTLIDVLQGILEPTKGEVLFNDKNIYKSNEIASYKNFGSIFQNYNLFDDLSVYQNLYIVTELMNINEKLILEKLDEYHLSDFKDKIVSDLSGGEKQRIAFLRAILNSPKVLFCDEPTGAIDEENSKLIMDFLRSYAKNNLVLIVTHNSDLIFDNDAVIKLENGELEFINFNFSEEDFKIESINQNKKQRNGYKRVVAKKLVKKSSFKHVLFLISTFFSFIFIFLTIGGIVGLNKLKGKLEFTYENFNEFQISEREKRIETNSPLTLIKEVRPDKELIKETLKNHGDFEIYNNYSYFLNGKNHIYCGNEELKNVKIALSYNLKSGVKINSNFEELLKDKKGNISLELNQNYTYRASDLKTYTERFYFKKYIKRVDVVKEFKYLNSPTIYLSLFEFENYMKENYLDLTFKNLNKKVNWFSIIKNAKNDDPITSYSYFIYFPSKADTSKFYSYIDGLNEDNNLKIVSEPHIFSTSFTDIGNIFAIGLSIFCLISIVTSICLLCFIVVAIYLDQKKDIAILMVLGAKHSDINSIFRNVMLLETFISLLFSGTIYILISRLINQKIISYCLYNQCINSLQKQILILISLGIFSLLIISLVVFLSLLKFKKKSHGLLLREE